MTKRSRMACLAVCLLSTFLFCSSIKAKEQVFAFNNLGEPETIDPTLATGAIEEAILNALFEGLTSKDPETLKPVSGVAQSWKISKDGTRYTFILRKNARWSNGDPVVANDFVYSWKRALNPKTGATLAYHLHYIVGAKDYSEAKISDFSKVGVKALDPHTLEVRLNHAVPYFLYLCSFYPLYPIHQKTIEKFGTKWTRVKNFVGNGPFMLTSWRPNDKMVTKRSKFYWDSKAIFLDGIEFHAIENKNTALNLYRTGKIHWTGQSSIPVSHVEAYRKRADFHSSKRLATDFYRLNISKPPFNDKRLRKALSLSIDRKRIAQLVGQGPETMALSLAPQMNDYQPGLTADFNPQEAVKIFTEAGYCTKAPQQSCKDLPPIELLYNTNERHQKVALAIQQMWKQHLGINSVNLLNREWKTFLKDLKASQFQLIRSGWVADFPDAINFLEVFRSDSTRNFTHWKNANFDRLIEQARVEADKLKRAKLLQQAENILMGELPIIPTYHYTSNYLLSPKVKGFYSNYMDVHTYKGLRISHEK